MPEIKKNLVRKNYGGVTTFPFLFRNACENLNVYIFKFVNKLHLLLRVSLMFMKRELEMSS